jgi:hypothetical protein
VSLVDGYSIPITMTSYHRKGTNRVCPAGLTVHEGRTIVGCRSAYATYGLPQHCCMRQFGVPQQCKPTAYSRLFKSVCPKAYSYAYDDPTSILTCFTRTSYFFTFCPHHH